MLVKISHRDIVNRVIAILLIFIGLLNLESDNVVFIAYLTLLVSIINFWNARKNIIHMVIFGFILFANYSICISLYINPIDNDYTSLVNTRFGSISICVLLIFNALLLLLNSNNNKDLDFSEKFVTDDNYNGLIVVGAIILTMLIFIFGYGRAVGEGERGEVSAIYEYAVIIFLFGFMYSGRNMILKSILLIIAVLYCVQDLLYGGRITSLQLIIMVYLVFFHDKKINLIKTAPWALLGLLIFSAVGELRGNFNFSIESLANAFKSLCNGSFSLDTAYAAFYASQIFVMVSFLDPWALRLKNLGAFIVSLFGGGGPNSNLSLYTQKYSWHYGGGVTPFYFYYYLGLLGVFLIAIYVSFLLRKFSWKRSQFSRACMIFIAYSVPRWYLYSASILIRNLVIFALVFFLCAGFHKLSTNRSV